MMLSLIMPYYNNPIQLSLHYKEWQNWDEIAKHQVLIILVDDGSVEQAIDVPRPQDIPGVRIYRIKEDKLWNQHGARNLGAFSAPNGWMLLTDMDHVLEKDSCLALLKRLHKLDNNTAYMLHRIEADTRLPTLGKGNRKKPHPNSFVITKELFWKVGGYDEDFCGLYGTDGLFKERLYKIAKKGFLKKVALTRYSRDIIPDASTRNVLRKEGRIPGQREAVLANKAARGEMDVVKTLQFEWERQL